MIPTREITTSNQQRENAAATKFPLTSYLELDRQTDEKSNVSPYLRTIYRRMNGLEISERWAYVLWRETSQPDPCPDSEPHGSTRSHVSCQRLAFVSRNLLYRYVSENTYDYAQNYLGEGIQQGRNYALWVL